MKKKRILYCMLKTLGDVVLSTTIIRELKKEYPESEIYFYTNGPYAGLLSNNPDIHEIKASREWLPDMVFMDIAREGYDLVFAPYQVRHECNIWHQEEATRHQHLVDFYWNRMGMHRPITDRECYLYPSETDHKKASDLVSFDVPRVAVHSTTGVPDKDWPIERFNEMTEELRKAGYAVLQVGATADRKVEGAIDFRGRMSFLEIAAFLSKCAAFVGLDSGISYISDTMKIPTIVIQGSTDPVTSGPISNRVIHLFAKETGYADCQVIRCHMNCRHEINCNTKITVDNVLDALEPVMDKWRKPIPAGV